MTYKVLIDYDMRGWADENETKITNDYAETLRVGIEPNPPKESSDETIASFCEENNCDQLHIMVERFFLCENSRNARPTSNSFFDRFSN